MALQSCSSVLHHRNLLPLQHWCSVLPGKGWKDDDGQSDFWHRKHNRAVNTCPNLHCVYQYCSKRIRRNKFSDNVYINNNLPASLCIHLQCSPWPRWPAEMCDTGCRNPVRLPRFRTSSCLARKFPNTFLCQEFQSHVNCCVNEPTSMNAIHLPGVLSSPLPAMSPGHKNHKVKNTKKLHSSTKEISNDWCSHRAIIYIFFTSSSSIVDINIFSY